jgi:hypothetical protein
MNKIFLILLMVITLNLSFAQSILNFNSTECESTIFIGIVKKLCNHKLTAEDFSNESLFFTTDVGISKTEHLSDGIYEFENPNELIKKFYEVFDCVNKKGEFYHYYELINNKIIGYPLHQSFFIDGKDGTYIVNIWNNKNDVYKIDGLNIHKKN